MLPKFNKISIRKAKIVHNFIIYVCTYKLQKKKKTLELQPNKLFKQKQKLKTV